MSPRASKTDVLQPNNLPSRSVSVVTKECLKKAWAITVTVWSSLLSKRFQVTPAPILLFRSICWLPAASVEMTVAPKLGVCRMLWIGSGADNKFITLI